MIDYNRADLCKAALKDKRILILERSVDVLNILMMQWVHFIKKERPDAFSIKYDDVYRAVGFDKFQEYICDFVEKNHIEIILFPEVNTHYLVEFDLETLARLREKVFMVACFPDVYMYYDYFHRYLAQYFDLILVEAYYEKFRFKLFGDSSIYWPYCYDATFYKPLDVRKDVDISFVGAAFKKGRKEYVEFLLEHDVKLETYGLLTKNGQVTDKQMVEVFNRSKINLNFAGVDEYMVDASTFRINNRYKQIKGRVSQVLLTKSFLLTEYDPTLDRLFEIGPGKDLDVFRSKEELLEKVRFYLGNPAVREKMAASSYAKAKDLFDCSCAVTVLLKIIHQKAGEKKAYGSQVYLDKVYLHFIAAIRLYWVLKHLTLGQFRFAWEQFRQIIKGRRFSCAASVRVMKVFSVKLKKLLVKFNSY